MDLNGNVIPDVGLVEDLLSIGIALSAEKDHNRLLEKILAGARRITNADAGTLYLCEKDRLVFKILHNKTMNTFRGGGGEHIDIPPVKLARENVSAYVALTGKTVNIPDVYNTGDFDFSGPRNYDKITGYLTRSMLVVPMENHESQIIGVLQLINAIEHRTGEIIPFEPAHQRVIEALASQAAIALTNAKLIGDIERLFDSFVQTITTAIDARTPYNANHSRRVALLAGELARAINRSGEGIWRDEEFGPERLEQLVMAGWLHDIGKVATPLEVMNKATRLDSRMELVLQRFQYIEQLKISEWRRRRFTLLECGDRPALEELDRRCRREIEEIKEAREIIIKANDPATFIDDQLAGRLAAIAARTYPDAEGGGLPFLSPDELDALTVKKGTLTDRERGVMEDHVIITARMLEKIPFIRKYARVPEFSAMHHEHLDGRGYPNRLAGDSIPLEARILALVDVYDALTAGDRPYKKAMPVEEALKILGFMVKDGKLDAGLYELFKASRPWEKVEE
jgi:HD-GYP domain-containing protein (c-di-GMP phosphodiesterase class II)